LNDFHDCFVFHHYDEIVQKGGSKYKRPVKRDAYTLCKKSGIRNFLKHFGITPKEFGSSVESVLKTPVQDDPSDPDEVAERYISADFSSTESVLKAAQFMFVKELTIEPRVRRYFRNRFWLDAVINTDLTSNGKRELNDEFHPLRAVKHVRDKLIVELASSDLYLLITKAKREGLITYDIKLPDWVVQDITQDIEKFFFSDSTSTVARKWNEIRRRIVNDLKDEMSKLLTAQLEEKLKREATQYVAKVCAQQLENMLLKGPYQPPTPKPVDEWDAPAPAEVDADVSVIGFSWGRFEEPTYAAYIDPEGELQAQESFNILSSTRAGDAEATRLAEFIRQHNPTAVVLGTDGYSTRTLFTLIERCMQQLRDEDDSFKPKPITFMDTNIAHIYANSKRAKDEFPGYPAGLLRAISTARRLLDPLPEIAGLCNQDNEIASLQLHQLKELVPKDQLLSRLERPFLAVVNSVGVEINRVVDHKWVEPLLQFVCGLGPRKAQALLQSLRGRVRSRKDLQKVLGSCVYTNCVAFLRIFHTTEENEDGDFLDNMRIHPDDYELAQKIARDAIDAEREGDDNIDYVRKLVDEPAKLDDIDLVMCAQYLEEEFQAKKLETLKRMKEEFHAPFLDCRRPYADPSFEEVFDLLTGESGDSLAVGQIVSVRVLDVGEKGVRVALDNGLTGLIPVSLFTDNRRSLDWNNDWPRIKEEMQGSTIQAKIKEINKERFFVVLTTRASDMQTAEDEAIAREKRAQARKPRFYHRAVAHPFFKNITHEEAIKYLADKEPGEYLIRPSSRGPNYLTITWKFYGGLYANIEVREEGKENAYTLGKKLTIEGRSYEDLNELFITFVDPMAMNANDMVSYNKYKEGDQTTLEQSLREEKQGNPARIPYLIGLNYKNPGSFIIYYIPNNSLRKEPIGLTPEGFKFRDKVFKDPDQLVGWFKRHFNDPIPQKKRPVSSSGAPPVAPHNEWDGGYSNNDWDTRATPADRRRTDPRGPRRDNYNRGEDYRSNRRDNDRDDYRSRDAGGSSGWASSSWDRPTYEQPQATASEWD
jgi:transcription elongation factor SPT6